MTTHPTKKGVVAVEEQPLFPDFDLWRCPFALVHFDADPAPANCPQDLAVQKMSSALVRGESNALSCCSGTFELQLQA